MSISNKEIAASIIDFLKSSVANKTVSEDYAESMDVAIDCVADAFGVDKDDTSARTKLGGKSLAELVAAGVSGAADKAPADDQTKAKADELKLEGNRAMAARKFEDAIDKYTQAIALDDTNVVYLSNRAAAYSSNAQHDKAVADAEKAISLNPAFSKSYSRLGLAKYALGDAQGAMDAYKQGLDAEGETHSEAMKKGFETAKRRVEEELEKTTPKSDLAATETPREGAGAGAAPGGMPDLSSMFGGAGGMPGLSDLMNNPQIMQAAQQMMQNPEALQGLMNNPMLSQMAQNFGLGGENGQMPDMSELMNNPMLRNMANQFMGGNNNGNPNSDSGSGSN